MFSEVVCTYNNKAKHLTNVGCTRFLQTVFEENRLDQEIYNKEMLKTIENPYVRDRMQTKQICEKLYEINRQKYLKGKRIQWLRDNKHELRQLKLDLHFAECLKEVTEQRKKKDAEKIIEHEKNIHYVLAKRSKEKEQNAIELAEKMKQKAKEKARYRNFLINQINENLRKKKQQFNDKIKDRDVIRQHVAILDAEELKILQNNEKNKQIKCKEFLETMHQLELNKKRKFSEHLKKRMSSDSFMKNQDQVTQQNRKAIMEMKAALSYKMGVEQMLNRSVKLEQEEQLVDLLIGERLAKEEMRYQKSRHVKTLNRIKMRKELDAAVREKQYYEFYEKEYQKRLAEESDRIPIPNFSEYGSKLVEERLRNLNNTKILTRMADLKRKINASERKQDIDIHKKLLSEQKKEEQEISYERLRHLRQKSADLLSYLPSGALKKIDPEFIQSIKKHKNETIGDHLDNLD